MQSLMLAIKEARIRATEEYLTRHPNGILSTEPTDG